MTDLAEVAERDVDGARVVGISGEIDLSNAISVMERIGESVRSGASIVVVDLSELTFIDSTGISMLFRLAERIRYGRQELRLVVPPGTQVRRVLEMTKVGEVIPMLESAGT